MTTEPGGAQCFLCGYDLGNSWPSWSDCYPETICDACIDKSKELHGRGGNDRSEPYSHIAIEEAIRAERNRRAGWPWPQQQQLPTVVSKATGKPLPGLTLAAAMLDPGFSAEVREAVAQQLEARKFAKQFTAEDVLAMFQNLGHDTSCDACMEAAFTGSTNHAHTCKSTVANPGLLDRLEEDLQTLRNYIHNTPEHLRNTKAAEALDHLAAGLVQLAVDQRKLEVADTAIKERAQYLELLEEALPLVRKATAEARHKLHGDGGGFCSCGSCANQRRILKLIEEAVLGSYR